MLPASNRGVGMNFGFPDVCLTPTPAGPVPIPYPNFALNAQAVGFSPIVKVSGVHALNIGSTIPMTFGDDAGTAHPVFKKTGTYLVGNPIVHIDRLPAVNLTCPTMGNSANNAVGMVVVPSAVNVVYTYARCEQGESIAASSLTLPDVRELGTRISGVLPEEALWIAMADEGLGYMRVHIIPSDMERRFFVAMKQLEEMGASSIIIDMRGCPGGDLDAVIGWAGSFLDEGLEIARIEDSEGDIQVRRSSREALYTMPLTLFIDGGTASAATIFAACMRAHGRAALVGERTHPKGTAQGILPASDLGFEMVISGRCFGPGGIPIDGVGVAPDMELPS